LFMRCEGTMRPAVVLFLWWRSRIFVYRTAGSSTHCATSTFWNGECHRVACSLSLARNHTGKFCSFNYIPISFDGFWSYCFGSGRFPISVWPDAHGVRLARSARYRASRIRFSFWRWSSFGDPRKHEMRTLCRAATRSSASLHQRNCQ
jgi:hypothetical protein